MKRVMADLLTAQEKTLDEVAYEAMNGGKTYEIYRAGDFRVLAQYTTSKLIAMNGGVVTVVVEDVKVEDVDDCVEWLEKNFNKI